MRAAASNPHGPAPPFLSIVVYPGPSALVCSHTDLGTYASQLTLTLALTLTSYFEHVQPGSAEAAWKKQSGLKVLSLSLTLTLTLTLTPNPYPYPYPSPYS